MMLTNRELKISRHLQGDLEMSCRPFADIARQTNLSEREVIDATQQMIKQGFIRKFAAIIRHRKAGFTENAMVIWAVSESRCEQAGRMLASFPEITHCYERSPAFEGKYNLFSMIHLRSQKIEEKVAAIAQKTGLTEYRILISEEEYKKSSMEYFS